MKRNLELSKTEAKGSTEIYEIQFDKRNKEKFFLKDKNEKEDIQNINNNEETKGKNSKIMTIASGVYVMKFLLTQNSFIPNK